MLNNLFCKNDNGCGWPVWIIILFLILGGCEKDCCRERDCCDSNTGCEGILIILLIFLLLGNDC